MNEKQLTDLLERAADQIPVGPAPVEVFEAVGSGPAQLSDRTTGAPITLEGEMGRRRGRGVAVGIVAATIALVAGAGAVLTLGPNPVEPKPAVVPTGSAPIPPNSRLVGIGHAAIAVPKSWGTNEYGCGTPERDTVLIDLAIHDACGSLGWPEGLELVEIESGEPKFDVPTKRAIVIDGVTAQRYSTTCDAPREIPGFGVRGATVCNGAVYLPTENVWFRVSSSTSGETVDELLSRIRVLPDKVAVPGYGETFAFEQERSGEVYMAALRKAGFEVATRSEPAKFGGSGYVESVDPPVGSMVTPGSLLTVAVSE